MKKLVQVISKPITLLILLLSLVALFTLRQAISSRVYERRNSVVSSASIKHNKTVEQSLAYLKSKEKFVSYLYKCSAGAFTIGYGDTFFHREFPQVKTITEKQASDRLQVKIEQSYAYLSKLKVEDATRKHNIAYTQFLNAQQLTALVSFIYNVGETGFSKSTLKRLLDKKMQLYLSYTYPEQKAAPSKLSYLKQVNKLDKQIEGELKKWTHIKGKKKYEKLKGLEIRRAEEVSMLVWSKKLQ